MHGGRGGRNRGRGRGQRVPDDIRATLLDHVVNHSFNGGRYVQPNVNRSTASSIVQTFGRENRYKYAFFTVHTAFHTKQYNTVQLHTIYHMRHDLFMISTCRGLHNDLMLVVEQQNLATEYEKSVIWSSPTIPSG